MDKMLLRYLYTGKSGGKVPPDDYIDRLCEASASRDYPGLSELLESDRAGQFIFWIISKHAVGGTPAAVRRQLASFCGVAFEAEVPSPAARPRRECRRAEFQVFYNGVEYSSYKSLISRLIADHNCVLRDSYNWHLGKTEHHIEFRDGSGDTILLKSSAQINRWAIENKR